MENKLLEEFKKDIENPQGFNNVWFEITAHISTLVQFLIEKNIVTEEEYNKKHDIFKNIAKEEAINRFKDFFDDKEVK